MNAITKIELFLTILLGCVISAMAESKNVTMQVGETQTMYLPSSVTSKTLRSVNFYSNAINYVQVVSHTNYSVKVKAVKAFSSPVIVRCDYYYLINNGGYTYQASGFYDFVITVEGEDKVTPTRITFPTSAVGIEVGESRQLTPTMYPVDAEYTLTWSINDRSVATVSQDGLLVGKSEGAADLTVKADNGVYTMLRVVVSEPSASSVSISPSKLELTEGNSGYLNATVYPSSATQTVTWATSNSSVATVSSSGKVTAIAGGNCTITAKTSNNRSASATVKVLPKKVAPTSISLSQESVEIEEGANTRLSATVLPANATTAIRWSTSDNSIATAQDGLITGVSAGECTVSATTDNGLTASASVVVKAKEILPESIELSSSSIQMKVGEKASLTARVMPENVTTVLTWSTTNQAVATVADGEVTATGEGECVVTVKTQNGLEASCNISVTKPVVLPQSIALSENSLELEEGERQTVTAKVNPSDAVYTLTWTSSDNNVATVLNGTVYGVSAGECTVTAATDNGLTASASVVVRAKEILPKTIELSSGYIQMEVGERTALTAHVMPENATTVLTWGTTNPAVATVDNGEVTAIGEGYCEITVSTPNGLTASCTVTVTRHVVIPESINVSYESLKLTAGETASLTATVYPSDAEYSLTWTSSDVSVAMVTDGTVKAVAEGSCIITVATQNGLSATCQVTVEEDAPVVNPNADWSGTYLMQATVDDKGMSDYRYPSDFLMTINKGEDDRYYITTFIGLDCLRSYPYTGLRLTVISDTEATIDLEYEDNAGSWNLDGRSVDGLHNISPDSEYSYLSKGKISLTRNGESKISISDFYVYYFGQLSDYEQVQAAHYTDCHGTISEDSGIPLTISDESPETKIEVYTLNGHCIYAGEKGDMPELQHGLYIIRCSNKTYKISK